jgi:hypothetical protein
MTPRIIAVGEELPALDDVNPPSSASRPAKAKGKHGSGKRRSVERFATLNAFVDFSMAPLKPSERAAWLVLWRDTKPDGIARTSGRDLARRCGICERSARYAIKSLERRGLLRIVRRGGLRAGPSSYRVIALEPAPPACKPLPTARGNGAADTAATGCTHPIRDHDGRPPLAAATAGKRKY